MTYVADQPQCTARSKRSGERCKNKACFGSNVCRMHGAKGGRPIVHGIYSKRVNTSLAEVYQEFLEETDNVEALNNDIALMRAMMVEQLQHSPNSEDERAKQANAVLRFMSDIRDTISLKENIETKYMVNIETIQIFLNQVLFILKKNISDEEQLARIVNELQTVRILDNEQTKIGNRK